MTIIDTTLYLDGALRLSRHGARKGGTVLVHEPSGRQVSIHPDRERTVPGTIAHMEQLGWRAGPIFDAVEFGERDYQTVLDAE